jgi:hypothetical protein
MRQMYAQTSAQLATAKAAANSASFASRQFEIERLAFLKNRAHLDDLPLNVIEIAVGKPPHITIGMVNGGKDDARDVRVFADARFVSSPPVQSVPAVATPPTTPGASSQQAVLGQNREWVYDIKGTQVVNDERPIENQALYVWGEVLYTDALSNVSPIPPLKFCFYYPWKNIAAKERAGHIGLPYNTIASVNDNTSVVPERCDTKGTRNNPKTENYR